LTLAIEFVSRSVIEDEILGELRMSSSIHDINKHLQKAVKELQEAVQHEEGD